jgi:hypothetical protein
LLALKHSARGTFFEGKVTLLFVAIWIAANWWFVEGLALFASFSLFGFV